MDDVREEDPELTKIREFFELWPIYLRLDTAYTTARIIEIACEQAPNGYDKLWLKEFLLTVAATQGRESEISPKRLGKWLQRISRPGCREAPADQGSQRVERRLVSSRQKHREARCRMRVWRVSKGRLLPTSVIFRTAKFHDWGGVDPLKPPKPPFNEDSHV